MKSGKQIISASRRTDIPAFYPEWFLNRIKAGYCLVQNPFNSKQISKVSLLTQDVEAFIFWTRNPKPFSNAVNVLEKMGYNFGFMVTVTNYPDFLETNKTDHANSINAVKNLSQQIGADKIVWRYDPIILANDLHFEWHIRNFARLAKELSPLVRSCVISFVDFYRKTLKNLKSLANQGFVINPFGLVGVQEFLIKLNQIAHENGLKISACCETSPIFENTGISHEGCINKHWLEEISPHNFSSKKHKGQRKNCNCIFSKDIGAYNSCKNGCLYCYATESVDGAKNRFHDPNSEKL